MTTALIHSEDWERFDYGPQHPLRLTRVEVSFETHARRGEVAVQARVRTVDKTGVEMEALTAAGIAALTVYDMVKALEKGVTITNLQLLEKTGGKSGDWKRSRQPSKPGHPRSKPALRHPLQ